ncbi:MAG: LytTR family DNA-binding domain-containing protein [Firmicutes bacterium]|jgi:DNA-binding LytR/AlgR family response regulator|nr:LytTR family DNA-binding domain-containing protein [Bacillota bacterium]
MINIIICDDERPQVDLMEYMLFKYGGFDLIKVYKAYSPNEFLDIISNHRIDIGFIDIRLNNMKTGIDIASELRKINENTILVFVTGFKEYGYDSYKVKAFDYYLKPLEEESFKSLLIRVKQEYNKRISIDHEKVFVARSGSSIVRIPLKDIFYFEKIQRKVIVYSQNKNVEISTSIKEILKENNIQDFFFRCHQGYLVNRWKLEFVEKDSIKLMGLECRIPVGRKYKKKTREEFMEVLF